MGLFFFVFISGFKRDPAPIRAGYQRSMVLFFFFFVFIFGLKLDPALLNRADDVDLRILLLTSL
jgi:hypothetical protein